MTSEKMPEGVILYSHYDLKYKEQRHYQSVPLQMSEVQCTEGKWFTLADLAKRDEMIARAAFEAARDGIHISDDAAATRIHVKDGSNYVIDEYTHSEFTDYWQQAKKENNAAKTT